MPQLHRRARQYVVFSKRRLPTAYLRADALADVPLLLDAQPLEPLTELIAYFPHHLDGIKPLTLLRDGWSPPAATVPPAKDTPPACPSRSPIRPRGGRR